MATATEETEAPPLTLMDIRYRISVEQYFQMADLGFFDEDPRVELLDGVIVRKLTKNTPHIISSELLRNLLHRVVPAGYFVSMGNPVSIPERDSAPEPDATVVRGSPRDYAGLRRDQADSPLVVEVAHTSYPVDRKTKWAIYAAARIPIYWIVDLNRRVLEVYDDPTGEETEAHYRGSRILGPDDEVGLVLDGREVVRFFVRKILP